MSPPISCLLAASQPSRRASGEGGRVVENGLEIAHRRSQRIPYCKCEMQRRPWCCRRPQHGQRSLAPSGYFAAALQDPGGDVHWWRIETYPPCVQSSRLPACCRRRCQRGSAASDCRGLLPVHCNAAARRLVPGPSLSSGPWDLLRIQLGTTRRLENSGAIPTVARRSCRYTRRHRRQWRKRRSCQRSDHPPGGARGRGSGEWPNPEQGCVGRA